MTIFLRLCLSEDYFGIKNSFLVKVKNLTIRVLVSIFSTSRGHKGLCEVNAYNLTTLAKSHTSIRSNGSNKQLCKFRSSNCKHCKEEKTREKIIFK